MEPSVGRLFTTVDRIRQQLNLQPLAGVAERHRGLEWKVVFCQGVRLSLRQACALVLG
jgi:hypothetical protein